MCNNLFLLFVTGKVQIGTKLAEFCCHALLALDVLTHPRALSLEKAVPVGSGLNYSAQAKTVFGGGTYQISAYRDQPQAMEVEDMYDDWLASTKDDEPVEAAVNDSGAGAGGTMLEDGRQLNPTAEDKQIGPPRNRVAAQDVPPSSSKSDVNMVDAAADGIAKPSIVENPASSNAVLAPVYATNSDSQKHAIPSFPEQKPTDQVGHLENRSPAINVPSSKLGTSDEVSDAPVVDSGHQAPEGRSTSFAELFGSESGVDSESDDSVPDIVDGDPDSD
jgi:hypothetical protein